MRKLEFTDNVLKEKVGLSKIQVDLQKNQFRIGKKQHSLNRFSIDSHDIIEGIFKIDTYSIFYKNAAKKVRVPRLDSTIKPNKNLPKEYIAEKFYNFWYPTTYWAIAFTGEIYLLNMTKSLMLPAPILNLWKLNEQFGCHAYKVCIGHALENINTAKDQFAKARQAGIIVNTILSGKMNLDLPWVDATRLIKGSMEAANIHKLFLQISFIHNANIHNADEANKWWKTFYKDPSFFKDLVFNHEVYDTKLLTKYKLA